MIQIKLNDKEYSIEEGTTLQIFIDSLNIKQQGIAVAIDYEVIPKAKWRDIVLVTGQELMLIHAVSGG